MRNEQVIDNGITVVVLNRALTVQLDGPLLSCLGLRYSWRLNGAGDYEAQFSAHDLRAAALTPIRYILDFYWQNRLVYRGLVEQIDRQTDSSGRSVLTVRGRDMTAELAELSINYLDLSNSGSGVTDAPYEIVNVVSSTNQTWAVQNLAGAIQGNGASITSTAVYAKFAGESALSALVRTAEQVGEHWRVRPNGSRNIVWMGTTTPSSGIAAVQSVGDAVEAESNPRICLIQSLAESSDAHALLTRIYPYGGGDGEVRLTLASTGRTAGAGFALDKVNNYIRNSAQETALGVVRSRHVEFKGIRPVSNTDADLTAASNALYDAALAYLVRNDEVADTTTYTLSVAALPEALECGETIRVVYQDDRYVVDDDFVVLDISTTIDAAGRRKSSLIVSSIAKFADTPEAQLVNDIEQGKIYSAHPQMNSNSYTTGYTKFVYNDGVAEETAVVRFRLGDEVVQVQQVIFEFDTDNGTRMLPLESTVRSVAGTSTTTNASGDHTHSVTIAAHTHTVTIGDHTHTVTIADHDHDIPDHKHYFIVYPQSGSVNSVNLSTGGSGSGTLGHSSTYFSGNQNVYTTTTIDANTTTSGGGSTPTSSSGGGSTPTTSSGGSSTPTSGGGGDHTHNFTPNITMAYGLYRESDANTFNLADLQYQVNSTGWHALDTDAVAAGGNWFALDITADVYNATTFRPNQANNQIEFKRKTSGTFVSRKSCTIDGLLTVRNIIQSIAYT